MKILLCTLFASLLMATAAWPQANAQGLEGVLNQMDAAARNFRSAQASLVWDQYQKVIDETDTQKGMIYFRRQGKDTQMAVDITEPDKKYVVYGNGKLQVYQPKIDQITEYNAGKNRAELESFLVLGFGAGGHDLLKSYDVKYVGQESVSGVQTAKLELIPKSPRVRNNVSRILLWVDPAHSVSVQQQFFEPGGNYRLTKYSDLKINQKMPDSVFKLKTGPNTKTVAPQG